MKQLLPLWAHPLNVFQMHGNMCCQNMMRAFQQKPLIANFLCYEARSISDANVLLLWGSFSKKLIAIASDEKFMPHPRAIIHLRGCDKRVDNAMSSSSLGEFLPIAHVFSRCIITPSDAKTLVHEARLCLIA